MTGYYLPTRAPRISADLQALLDYTGRAGGRFYLRDGEVRLKSLGRLRQPTELERARIRHLLPELEVYLECLDGCALCGQVLGSRTYLCANCQMDPDPRPAEPSLVGDQLRIPCDAPERFRWWDGGQSPLATARELGMSEELVQRRYADLPGGRRLGVCHAGAI